MRKTWMVSLIISISTAVYSTTTWATDAVLPKNEASGGEAEPVSSSLQDDTSIEVIRVVGKKTESIEVLKSNNSAGGDTIKLLKTHPSVHFQTGGGMSSLPIINGMASDRVNVKVDGTSISASCPNHMNPALSYITPNKVDVIEAIAGVVPVSQGGDSLGGSIIAKSKKMSFAGEAEDPKYSGQFSSLYGSNEDFVSVAAGVGYASRKNTIEYRGTEEEARNYTNGDNKTVNGTLYKQRNHSLAYSRNLDVGALTFRFTRTEVPEQAFVNQYMDLLENTSHIFNMSYEGLIGGLKSEVILSHQTVDHYMNKIKKVRTGNMPMNTDTDETSLNVKTYLPQYGHTNIQLGAEAIFYKMDDYWPPDTVNNMPGMSPGTFLNINNGQRNRFGFFTEAESQWNPDYFTNIGLRADVVSMNTDEVKGYNDTTNLPTDADYFNSLDRKKTDVNYDATFINSFKISESQQIDLGFARKSRSPNLYERYAWAGLQTISGSGPAQMDMRMINWFGDGNGYVGNVDLKPEVAHTVSLTYKYQSPEGLLIKVTPYYSEVNNYIDADLLFTNATTGVNYLQFANHDAVVMGADLTVTTDLYSSEAIGVITGTIVASSTRGYRKDKLADLYNQMPLNGRVFVSHKKNSWVNDLEVYLVSEKKYTSTIRREVKTAGYALTDVSTGYFWDNGINLNFRVSNVFDQMYNLTLGGRDIVNSKDSVAGRGRSYQLGFSYDFL